MSDSFLAQFGEEETCTVSEYTRRIKRLLEGSVGPEWIKGEVSNFRRQASGHLYFSLKDEGAQLPVVMFRGNASGLDFDLDNGVEIVVYGELSVYEPHGRYQLIARSAIASGQGRLHREFERLKKKLFEEGLFDKEQLVKDVLAAAAAYSSEQLEKMWAYKTYVMEQVLAAKGGNDYPRHRA